MTPSQAAEAVKLNPIALALDAGDLDAADAAVARLGDAPSAESWPLIARVHLGRRRWADAARLLGRIIDPDPAARADLHLARNFTALEQHRPDLCARLAEAAPNPAYQIVDTPAGSPTLHWRSAAGQTVCLSPHNDPQLSLAQALAQLAESIDVKRPLALCGLGDGYLLAALAERDAPNAHGQLQCAHVIVDDPALLLAAFRLHDYSGPRGPIAQPRFLFHVGHDWPERLRAAVDADPTIPFPQAQIAHGAQGAALQPLLNRIGVELSSQLQRITAANRAHYASVTREQLVDAFGESPSRPPRVLAITSRFTTVLQHSTRDTLDAFERLGWQTHLLIEPADHALINPLAVVRAVEAFKPDLVFLIDHLRYEYADRFPPQLPLVCWIQDHLPNLTTPRAGASITPRDYVLTAIAPRYARQSGYPPRQMIDLPKLTRVPQRPDTWEADGDDLVYVSNASQTDGELVDTIVNAAGEHAALRRFVRACCDWVLAIYADGDALPSFLDLRRVVEATARQMNQPLDPAVEAQVIQLLMLPLNNALYRRQALRWAKAHAERRGLTLSIYGNGWEKLPEFAPHARGPVRYGPDLEELTRRSKINLQIVPYFCVHQRLLDGLVAGGFFLVREHPADRQMARVAAFLDEHAPADANTTDAARAALDGPLRAEFDQLMHDAAVVGDLGSRVDIVEQTRCAQRAGHVAPGGLVLPDLAEVSFHDAESLGERVDRFLADADARRATAARQRIHVEGRLTYLAGMGRVIREIHARLADERG